MSDAERAPSLIAGRYRLDERIGSGPMGEVWRGYDTRADWVVAVKVLGARAAGPATREVLRQHAQAVAKVIHPNVAMVLDVGEHDGAPFLVMEHLTGLSLGEELAARGSLTIVEVCDLIGQAAAGLDAAHRAGVVHGQVDPDAFRMAASGVLKVVGFGMDGREPVRGSGRYAAPRAGPRRARRGAGRHLRAGLRLLRAAVRAPALRRRRAQGSGGAARRHQGRSARRAGPAGARHARRRPGQAAGQWRVHQAYARRHRPPQARRAAPDRCLPRRRLSPTAASRPRPVPFRTAASRRRPVPFRTAAPRPRPVPVLGPGDAADRGLAARGRARAGGRRHRGLRRSAAGR
ncbi:protein kinase domain-containing protein [Nonomuraea salmonea]|uniref:protein kinase domain-containing protein n=1 Tax=Nonomuraea salmonea TaxID=46181 RepID=UPI0031E9B117